MSREPFETMPDVMDAKQLPEALQISKAGAYNLLNSPDFPTLRIGGRKLHSPISRSTILFKNTPVQGALTVSV